jgi:hypothetical protein
MKLKFKQPRLTAADPMLAFVGQILFTTLIAAALSLGGTLQNKKADGAASSAHYVDSVLGLPHELTPRSHIQWYW